MLKCERREAIVLPVSLGESFLRMSLDLLRGTCIDPTNRVPDALVVVVVMDESSWAVVFSMVMASSSSMSISS